MKISMRKIENITIIKLTGRLDASKSGHLLDQFNSLIEEGNKALAVDFADLDYISSSGLRIFLIVLKRLKTVEGRLVFFAMKEHVAEVFDLAGLSSHFPICSSEEEALRAIRESS